MNIIIVEDNKVVRSEITRQINRLDLDIDIINTFSNGKAALDFISSNKVDVAISDIQMPIMDGIEFIKAIKENNIKTKVIFLSCYDDFKYVKLAFEYGAIDYILKPIVAAECKEAIEKAYKAYKTEFSQQQFNRQNLKPIIEEQFFRNLLFGTNSEDDMNTIADFLDMPHDMNSITVVNAKIKAATTDSVNPCSNADIIKILKEKFDILSNDSIYIYNVTTHPDRLSIIFISEFDYDEITDIIMNFKNELFHNYNLSISFGISNSSKNLSDMHLMYEQASQALNYTFFSNTNIIIQYNEIKMLDESIVFSDLFADIKQIIKSTDTDNILPLINKYVDDSKVFSQDYIKLFSFSLVQSIEIILNEYNISIENVVGSKIWHKLSTIDTILNLKTWLYNIICAAIDLINQNSPNSKNEIVKHIKQIIHNRYAEKITINSIATELHYSAKYLSNVFNAEENKSIYEYLTEYRMEIAKTKLKTPGAKIYVVSESVGYTRKSHFYNIFKSYTGMTPSEYKNKYSPNETM